jgi:hypothetical protein
MPGKQRPLRHRGIRSVSGPQYWRVRTTVFRLLALFFGFATLLDAVGRIAGEATPRWSSLALTLLITLFFARLAYTSQRKSNDEAQ